MDKTIMLIGRSRSGKTTLIHQLLGDGKKSDKTQSVNWRGNFIDTPGEYMEVPRFYNALMVSSYDADLIIMVESVTEKQSVFPPNFSTAFNKPVIGVITKCDLEGDEKRVAENLRRAGAEEIFVVDYNEPESLNRLREYLKE